MMTALRYDVRQGLSFPCMKRLRATVDRFTASRTSRIGFSAISAALQLCFNRLYINLGPASTGQIPLSNAARGWTAMWLILKAMGWQAKDIKRPCSHPARVTFWNGNKSLTSTLISNPRFYEMVMGWPIGWTKAEVSVTGFAAWLRRSRIALSRLTLVE